MLRRERAGAWRLPFSFPAAGEGSVQDWFSRYGVETDFLSADIQFFADLVPVEVDGARGKSHDGPDLLGALSLLDIIGDLELRRGQMGLRFHVAHEGGGEGPEIFLEVLDEGERRLRERGALEPLDAGHDQVVNVGHDLPFEDLSIGLPLFQERAQGDVERLEFDGAPFQLLLTDPQFLLDLFALRNIRGEITV